MPPERKENGDSGEQATSLFDSVSYDSGKFPHKLKFGKCGARLNKKVLYLKPVDGTNAHYFCAFGCVPKVFPP